MGFWFRRGTSLNPLGRCNAIVIRAGFSFLRFVQDTSGDQKPSDDISRRRKLFVTTQGSTAKRENRRLRESGKQKREQRERCAGATAIAERLEVLKHGFTE